MSRSPFVLLGAVVDEVEGLRRTDERSFLPAKLMQELREALGDQPSAITLDACSSDHLHCLVGQTVSHVFSNHLRHGDYLILCTDGTFVVLEAEYDGDSATVQTLLQGAPLSHFLRPLGLQEAGLMTSEQRIEAEKQEEIAHAEKIAARARAQVISAEAALAKLKTPPAKSPTEGGE